MESLPVTHPSADTLQAFGLGKLDDASAEAVISHLDDCTQCRQAVAAQSGDSFVERLRQAHDRHATRPPGQQHSKSASQPGTGSPQATPPPNATVPPELADHPQYDIVRELGRGGMGIVYLVHNRLLARQEVLKVVNKDLINQAGGKARFLREMQSAARLSHANVVTAYSAVPIGELLAFAMEYIDGQDLDRIVKDRLEKTRSPLPVLNACYYVQQAALGLQHAFEKNMVHRDIKPQNLILAREGKKHVVKILDFGLAKLKREKGDDGGLTGTGEMLGTPAYVAPEQMKDAAHADIRADIYSLGCTLYYLLTGRPPFTGKNLWDVLQAHHSMEAQSVHLVRPDVPEELSAVVKKMMAKDPANRYQTPVEVAQALMPFVKPGRKEGSAKPPHDLSPGGPEEKGQGGEGTNKPGVVGQRTNSEMDRGKRDPSAVDTGIPAAWDTLTESKMASADSRKQAALRSGRSPAGNPGAKKKWLIGAGVTSGLLLLGMIGLSAGGVFKVKTEDGILVVEVNEPNAEVYIDGKKMTVTWGDGGKKAEITIKPGTHKVEVKKDGFTVDGKNVTLKEGGRQVLTAMLERPGKVDPAVPLPTPPAVAPVGGAAGSLEQAARSFVELLDKGEFAKATNEFDAAMLKALPPDELKKTWEKVLAQAGAYKRQIGSRLETSNKFQIVFVTCEFAKSQLDAKVVFDKNGKITGLYFPPTKPMPMGTEIRKWVESRPMLSVSFSPDGRHLLTGGEGGIVCVYEVATGRKAATASQSWYVRSVAFSPSGEYALIGSSGLPVLRLWAWEANRVVWPYEYDKGQEIAAVGFSKDGRRFLCFSRERTIREYDTATGKQIHEIVGKWPQTTRMNCCAFSPDARSVFVGMVNGTIRLCKLETGDDVQTFAGHAASVACLAPSADGRILLSGGNDGMVRIWDVESRKEQKRFTGHVGIVRAVTMSPDERRVLSGGQDGTVRLWDIATGLELKQFKEHTGQVWSVAFSPIGDYIASAGADKTVRLWKLPSTKPETALPDATAKHGDGLAAQPKTDASAADHAATAKEAENPNPATPPISAKDNVKVAAQEIQQGLKDVRTEFSRFFGVGHPLVREYITNAEDAAKVIQAGGLIPEEVKNLRKALGKAVDQLKALSNLPIRQQRGRGTITPANARDARSIIDRLSQLQEKANLLPSP